ncbi:MAG: adenine phosphoribosyltransferase [Chloroflexi bacterium RBG_16_57_11]|nr:MAG: adenine phosphoribosyltransferase [Chloroflexi bacterium RBG_16_57_11]
MSTKRQTYRVQVAGLERDLRMFEVAPGVRIAVLNILGDTEFVQACALALTDRLSLIQFDVIVTAEAKSIPLAHAISLEMKKPYVVLRKVYKPYMGVALSAETLSITTAEPQMLFLDEKDQDLLRGKQVVLLDDVISTGSTLHGMRLLMEKAGAVVVKEAGVFTEGDRAKWEHIISLGHLPVFTGE